jgi:hypothetical protein
MAKKARRVVVREIDLLTSGWLPPESKIGEPFKGKNKVIIGK